MKENLIIEISNVFIFMSFTHWIIMFQNFQFKDDVKICYYYKSDDIFMVHF